MAIAGVWITVTVLISSELSPLSSHNLGTLCIFNYLMCFLSYLFSLVTVPISITFYRDDLDFHVHHYFITCYSFSLVFSDLFASRAIVTILQFLFSLFTIITSKLFPWIWESDFLYNSLRVNREVDGWINNKIYSIINDVHIYVKATETYYPESKPWHDLIRMRKFTKKWIFIIERNKTENKKQYKSIVPWCLHKDTSLMMSVISCKNNINSAKNSCDFIEYKVHLLPFKLEFMVIFILENLIYPMK